MHPVGPRDHDELPSPAAGDTRFGFGWFAREILRHRAIWRDVLVASAVLQVIGLTKSLGRRLASGDDHWAWSDEGGSTVRLQFQGGKLARFELDRPAP